MVLERKKKRFNIFIGDKPPFKPKKCTISVYLRRLSQSIVSSTVLFILLRRYNIIIITVIYISSKACSSILIHAYCPVGMLEIQFIRAHAFSVNIILHTVFDIIFFSPAQIHTLEAGKTFFAPEKRHFASTHFHDVS